MAAKWNVGDLVVVRADMNGMGGGTFRVHKIGRKYLSIVSHHRVRRFDLVTGQETSDGAGGYCVAMTPDESRADHERTEATRRVQGWIRPYGWERALSTEDLNKIADIIAAAHSKKVGGGE